MSTKNLPYIFINQLRLSRYPGLDIVDGAILAYCRSLVISKNEKVIRKRKMVDDEEYTWIDSAHLIRSMPLIKINNVRSVRFRLGKLVKAGLLERCTESKNIPYYKLTFKAIKMYKKVQYGSYYQAINKTKTVHPTIVTDQSKDIESDDQSKKDAIDILNQ